MSIDLLFKFSVTNEIDEKLKAIDVFSFLVEGEEVELAYMHMRDKVWFTNKRIITMDVQGMSGKKREFRTFPYSKISSFSIETSGTFDLDSDFKIWLSGVGMFQINFHKKLDIKNIGKFLSAKLIG
jgi:hypothetical protein